MTKGIFFIKAGEFTKIGYSSDVTRRLGELQADNPLKCELIAVLYTDNPSEVEKISQGYFGIYHHRAEWFNVPLDVLKTYCVENLHQYRFYMNFASNYTDKTDKTRQEDEVRTQKEDIVLSSKFFQGVRNHYWASKGLNGRGAKKATRERNAIKYHQKKRILEDFGVTVIETPTTVKFDITAVKKDD